MAFVGWEENKDLTVGECKASEGFRTWVTCPFLNYDSDYKGFDGEYYKCEKCGRIQFADYDEMR